MNRLKGVGGELRNVVPPALVAIAVVWGTEETFKALAGRSITDTARENMKTMALPFLGYCVLQLFAGVVGINISGKRRPGVDGALELWVMGQMLMYAILQAMAVPMILARWRFDALFWGFVGVCALLFGLGCARLAKLPRGSRMPQNPRKAQGTTQMIWLTAALLIATLALVGLQSYRYVAMTHLDEDDARWLAEANDALESGLMMNSNYNTGEYDQAFTVVRDITSPWPMMYAVYARVLRIRPSVFAHTIYPTAALMMMYAIYWLIGGRLFKKMEARATFLCFTALVNLYFGGTVYTQSAFTLVRIWQGKATVAAVVVPLLTLLFMNINKRDETSDWVKVIIVSMAAGLMSAMGTSLGLLMIGVYGLYAIVAYQRWKRVPLWIGAMLPSVAAFAIYFVLR